ncbi:MAG: hypothetical protein ACPGTU_03505 [Myxococcota bacterium]
MLCLVFGIATWARLRGLPAFSALHDALGPYWAAIRMDGRTHAPPYGPLMLISYIPATQFSQRLWDAVQIVGVQHSFVAVFASMASLRLWPKRLGLALLLGSLVALDPGLIDTAVSGSKGYFTATFVSLLLVFRGPWVWVCWAFAVSNHPLALCAAPLVVSGETLKKTHWGGILFFSVATLHQALNWSSPGVGSGPSMDPIGMALGGYIEQGGVLGGLVLLGPIAGLLNRSTRKFAIRILVGFGVLLLVGAAIGYLRDHHVRFFTVPALLCWGALPGRLSLVLLALVRIPPHPVFPAGLVARETTIGLAHRVVEKIAVEQPPFIVDGAWLSGGPSVEPSAALLDLYLRGFGAAELNADGDVVVIISAERDAFPISEQFGRTIDQGDRYQVVRANQLEVLEWSNTVCANGAKLGGAWDGLSVISPETDAGMVRAWWACD